jgi:hypothetical protein
MKIEKVIRITFDCDNAAERAAKEHATYTKVYGDKVGRVIYYPAGVVGFEVTH